MKIMDKPYLMSYINESDDRICFVISPEKSDERKCPTYAQFINGLFTGQYYTIVELYHMEDNGYKWINTH